MTRVIFRADKRGYFKGTITAVFVDEVFTDSRPKSRMSYEHVGQHGECCLEWIEKDTRPAKPKEYQELLSELVNQVGYEDLKILNRMPKGV